MSALTGMAWIFGVTVAIDLLTLLLGAEHPGKVVVRTLFLAVLFALLLKGYRFARYVLGILYLTVSLLGAFVVLPSLAQPLLAIIILPFSAGGFAAAWFFFRSKNLRAWTDAHRAKANVVV